MKTLLAGIVIVALGLRAAGAEDSTRQALAGELIVLMKVEDSIARSLEMVKKNLPAQMQQMSQATGQEQVPEQATAQMRKVMDLVAAEMSWDKLKTDYVELYPDSLRQ